MKMAVKYRWANKPPSVIKQKKKKKKPSVVYNGQNVVSTKEVPGSNPSTIKNFGW